MTPPDESLHDEDLDEVFHAEAKAILADLERSLLDLEGEGAGGTAQADAYRHFHTLKGMARMAGHEDVAALCHEAEAALQPGRSPDVQPLLATRDEVARLLRGRARDGEAPPAEPAVTRTVPVDLRRLDALLDLAGELVVAENRVRYEWSTRVEGDARDGPIENLGRIVRALQDEVVRARLIPVRTLLAPVPRLARDAARAHGKTVRVELDGGDLELDRAIIDRMTGALAHVVQNAVVHGIEPPDERAAAGKQRQGLVRVDVRREHELVLVEVQDDGRGVDPERVRRRAVAEGLLDAAEGDHEETLTDAQALDLLLTQGFTTRQEAGTHAGRGIGLTAARDVARALGGDLDVRSHRGEGTRVTFRLPPSIALLDTLVALAEDATVALPLRNVQRVAPASTARPVGNGVAILQDGAPIPVRGLSGEPPDPARGGFVLVADGARGTFGLHVERVLGTHSAVLKPVHHAAGDGRLLGATVLGSGEVALLLNPDAFGGDERS